MSEPTQGETPVRSIRVPARLADKARREASRRGITFSDVVVRALRYYLNLPAKERE